MNNKVSFVRVLFALVSVCMPVSFAQAGTISPFLDKAMSQGALLDVMVYLSAKPDLNFASVLKSKAAKGSFVFSELRAASADSQKAIVNLTQKLGLETQSFYIENAVLVKGVSSHQIKLLAEAKGVERVAVNAKIPMKPQKVEPVGPKITATDPMRLISADRVWDELGVRGSGIVVAGQDTGVKWDHESLVKQYRGTDANGSLVSHNYHWHDAIHTSGGSCAPDSPSPCDDRGHGTHTVGTIVGEISSRPGLGVAPDAQWIACRNMKSGVGTVSSYLECFEFFLAPYEVGDTDRSTARPDLAPHVINNSWSCPTSEGCEGGEFLEAIENLNAAGIMTVVAASNNGPGCESVRTPPAIYSEAVLTVGAYNRYRRDIAFFSSRGPSAWDGGLAPAVTAPGSNIHSAVHSSRRAYDEKSGTSMAAPHVVGVVALLWSARPELVGQVAETMRILKETADPITHSRTCAGFPGSQTPNAVFGWGMVNAWNAIHYDQ